MFSPFDNRKIAKWAFDFIFIRSMPSFHVNSKTCAILVKLVALITFKQTPFRFNRQFIVISFQMGIDPFTSFRECLQTPFFGTGNNRFFYLTLLQPLVVSLFQMLTLFFPVGIDVFVITDSTHMLKRTMSCHTRGKNILSTYLTSGLM